MAGGIRGIKVLKEGDWLLAEKIVKSVPQELDPAVMKALEAEAEYLVGRIKNNFGKNVAALSPNTLHFKKGKSKPLIKNADMKNSITKIRAGEDGFFIGVPRTASKGKVQLADVHENGRTIVMRITRKQRAWMHANLSKLKGPRLPGGKFKSGATGILVIHIPARPFIGPIWELEKGKIPTRFIRRVAHNLKGQLGTP